MPPVYWSTAIQWLASSESKGWASSCADVYRRKYHDESINVSIVSVSRRAARPYLGHLVRQKSALSASGLYSRGSSTGSSDRGTATIPATSQCTTGIGQPQYRWREINQSRSRYLTERLPIPFSSMKSATRSNPVLLSRPSNWPLLIITPGAV